MSKAQARISKDAKSLPSPQDPPLSQRQTCLGHTYQRLGRWIYKTYFAGFFSHFHWWRTSSLYLAWVFRLAYLAFLYQYWVHPFETSEWLDGFGLRAGIIRDGVFRGPFWNSLGLESPQPREGWEVLPPDYMIWRDEIAWVVTQDRGRETVEETFERWSQNWESVDGVKFKHQEGWFDGVEVKDPMTRAMLALQHDGVLKEGMEMDEWIKRMGILRYVELLKLEWEVFRDNKKWYIIIDHDSAPIISSINFFLSRLDFEQAYYLCFGTTTILSATAVQRLMETDAFQGLSLIENPADKNTPSLIQRVKQTLGLGTGKLVVTTQGTAPTFPGAVLRAAAKRRNIPIHTSLSHLWPSIEPRWLPISPSTQCQILLGFDHISRASGYIALRKNREPVPSRPLQVQDVWAVLDGFPSWAGMYGQNDGAGYFGRGGWDNVGPTSSNKTRLLYEYWGDEYAEYDDGSWSIILEDTSNDCQEICYEGGIGEPWGTRPKCLAYKSESLMKDGTIINNDADWSKHASGLTKCTFAPWKVVGEGSKFVWSMVHDLGVEWKDCKALDTRQFVGPRIFMPGGGTGCDSFTCGLRSAWDMWFKR